ncbi:sodium-dependent transporter, partial [bacterium]|nr:sodium-dependent transporter [bacterium]
MEPQRGAWGTRLGFYFAAIGVAFGLGNLWRFPYVVAENGGGAFVLLYIFLVFIVGIPLMT